jgi:hypothetical protein
VAAAAVACRLVWHDAPGRRLQALPQLTALGSGRQRVRGSVYSGLKRLARFGGIAGCVNQRDQNSGRQFAGGSHGSIRCSERLVRVDFVTKSARKG